MLMCSVSLVLRIAIGLVIGAILALIVPQASWIGMFGTIFVGALKAIAPVLVLVLVSSSLAQSREKLGSQFVTIVILYLLSTFLAAVVAVVGSMLFPVTITLADAAAGYEPAQGIGEVIKSLLSRFLQHVSLT